METTDSCERATETPATTRSNLSGKGSCLPSRLLISVLKFLVLHEKDVHSRRLGDHFIGGIPRLSIQEIVDGSKNYLNLINHSLDAGEHSRRHLLG
jgi:hypothetical protein